MNTNRKPEDKGIIKQAVWISFTDHRGEKKEDEGTSKQTNEISSAQIHYEFISSHKLLCWIDVLSMQQKTIRNVTASKFCVHSHGTNFLREK